MTVSFKEVRYLTEAGKKSGYSDEHAFAEVWNHSVENGTIKNREYMHKEIEAAKKDPKHPLHFDKISKAGFKGGDKANSSPDMYYKELHHAADTIHDVANHPDFAENVAQKHKASVAGAAKGQLHQFWTHHGGSNATSKADITIGEGESKKGLSYKKAGGSQLMSGEAGEVKATYNAAAAYMLHDKHMSQADHDELKHHVNKIADHLTAMKTSSREDMVKHRDDAQKLLEHVHNKHPLLNGYVHAEAASGNAKFGGGEGRATHVLTSFNEKHGNAHIMKPEDYKHPAALLSHPRIALPKGEGRPGNLKIDIRDHHTQ